MSIDAHLRTQQMLIVVPGKCHFSPLYHLFLSLFYWSTFNAFCLQNIYYGIVLVIPHPISLVTYLFIMLYYMFRQHIVIFRRFSVLLVYYLCSIIRITLKGRKRTKMEGRQSGTYLRQMRASSSPRVSFTKTYRDETKWKWIFQPDHSGLSQQ